MRLLRARSQEVCRPLNSINTVCACDLIADFPSAVIGSIAIANLFLMASVFIGGSTAVTVGAGTVIAWNGFYLWKARFTKRNWVVALTSESVFLRVFRRLGPGKQDSDPDVLGMLPSEINSMSLQVINIVWSSIRHTTIRRLSIEPKVSIDFGPEFFSQYGCETPRHRITVLQDGQLLLQAFWYPALEKLLARVSVEHPLVPVCKPHYVSFDLKRMRMPATDAARLMESL